MKLKKLLLLVVLTLISTIGAADESTLKLISLSEESRSQFGLQILNNYITNGISTYEGEVFQGYVSLKIPLGLYFNVEGSYGGSSFWNDWGDELKIGVSKVSQKNCFFCYDAGLSLIMKAYSEATGSQDLLKMYGVVTYSDLNPVGKKLKVIPFFKVDYYTPFIGYETQSGSVTHLGVEYRFPVTDTVKFYGEFTISYDREAVNSERESYSKAKAFLLWQNTDELAIGGEIGYSDSVDSPNTINGRVSQTTVGIFLKYDL